MNTDSLERFCEKPGNAGGKTTASTRSLTSRKKSGSEGRNITSSNGYDTNDPQTRCEDLVRIANKMNKFDEVLGKNCNKRQLSYAFVVEMKKRFLKCRFDESKNYIKSVLKSKYRTGIYLYEFPLFPLQPRLNKAYCQHAQVLLPVLKGLVDSGFFTFMYTRGKSQFMPYWRRLLKGEIWNPWIDKRIGTMTKEVKCAIKRIYQIFEYLPGWVNEQGSFGEIGQSWKKYAGYTCTVAGATMAAYEWFGPAMALATGLLVTGCSLLLDGTDLQLKVAEVGTKVCDNVIESYREEIMSRIREMLPDKKYLIPIGVCTGLVLGYLILRLCKSGILSTDMSLIYVKSLDKSGEMEDNYVNVTPHGKKEVTMLALCALALTAGVSYNTIARNYSTNKTIFSDLVETFSTDNIKHTMNWLADVMGLGRVFQVDDTWTKVSEIEDFISSTTFAHRMLSDKDDWDKFISYCDFVDGLPINKEGWSHSDSMRITALKRKMQAHRESVGSCDPEAMNRIAPVVVLLQGPTSQGKTTLAKLIAKRIYGLMHPDRGDVNVSQYMCSISQTNFPWESYNPNTHAVVLQDDFMQQRDSVGNGKFLEELYKILQDTPYVCDTAFGDKGKKRYKARGHIFSTNLSPHTLNTMGVNDSAAFFARMDICLSVELLPGANVNDFANSWKFSEWKMKGYKPKFKKQSITLQDLFEEIDRAFALHASKKTSNAVDAYDVFSNDKGKNKEPSGESDTEEEVMLALPSSSSSDEESLFVREQNVNRKFPFCTMVYDPFKGTYSKEIISYLYLSQLKWKEAFTDKDSLIARHTSDVMKKTLKDIITNQLPPSTLDELYIRHSCDNEHRFSTLITTTLESHELCITSTAGWPDCTVSVTSCSTMGPAVVQSQNSECDTFIERNVFIARLTGYALGAIAFSLVVTLCYFVGKMIMKCLRALSSTMPFLVSEQAATGDYSREKTKVIRKGDNVRKTCAVKDCNKVLPGAAKYCHNCGTPVTEQSLFVRNDNHHKQEVANKVVNNLWQLTVYTKDGLQSQDHILMLDGKHGIAAAHTLSRDIDMIILSRGKASRFALERANFTVTHYAGQHSSLLTLLTRTVATVRSIRSHLPIKHYEATKGEQIYRHDMYTTEQGDLELSECTGLVVGNTLGTNYRSLSGRFEINSGVVTDIKDNYEGLCGTPYFINTPDGYKVTHIHVAADNSGASLASCISLSMLPENEINIVSTQNFCIESGPCCAPKGTNPVGTFEGYMFVGNKSSYQPSMFRDHEHVGDVITHIPLQAEKSQIALDKSMRFKYREEMMMPESTLRDMALHMEDLMSDFRPPGKFKFLDIEEAVFGNGMLEPLESDTSVGPLLRSYGMTDRKLLFDKESKWIHPLLKYLVYFLWDAYRRGHYEEFVITLALKDEPLPLAKEIKRIFTVFDLHVLIFMRMCLGDLFAEQILRHNQSSCCIGINPHCVDWTILATELQRWPWLLDSDFSKFDVSMQEYAINLFGKYLARRCPTGYGTMIQAIVLAATNPLVICGRNAYIPTFNPSGWLLTLLLNDYINRFSHKYSIYRILLSKSICFLDIQDHFVCKTYGDDAIKSCSNLIKEQVSEQELCDAIKGFFGMYITAGDKDGVGTYYSKIENADFIGRGFRRHLSWYFAPLSSKSFNKMLHWIRRSKNLTQKESYQAIINSLVFESIPKGEAYYDMICDIVDYYAKDHFFTRPFANYASAWEYYFNSYLNRKVSPLSLDYLASREGL